MLGVSNRIALGKSPYFGLTYEHENDLRVRAITQTLMNLQHNDLFTLSY